MRNFILFLFSITIIITNNLYSQNNKKLDSEIASFLDTLKPETFSKITAFGPISFIRKE